MRLSGCLKEKINVIRPLEKFLRDFEKKVSTLFEPKVLINPEKLSAKFHLKSNASSLYIQNAYFN